jgi:hypothetical protein
MLTVSMNIHGHICLTILEDYKRVFVFVIFGASMFCALYNYSLLLQSTEFQNHIKNLCVQLLLGWTKTNQTY